MDEIKVSVIIPVYNTQNYLRQCLDSVCAQTLREIEIICVDDGSTDDSPGILEEYREKDSRVQVYHQQNLFAGVARNTGKAHASGKYLVFWDSDDYFYETALEKMFIQSERDQADICICGGNQFYEDKQIELPTGVYLAKKKLPEMIPFNYKTNPDYIYGFTNAAPWNKMFRAEFVREKQLDFQAVRNGNDVYFVICALGMAERITVVEEALVCYRRNQAGSLVGSLSVSPLSPIQAWIDAHDTLEKSGCLCEKSFANKALGSMYYLLRNIRASWPAFREAVEALQQGGLARMGIREQEEGYYYTAWHGECLPWLLHHTAEEFAVYFLHSTYIQLTESDNNKKIQAQKNKEKLDVSKKKTAELKKQLKDASEQLETQRLLMKKQAEEYGKLQKELKQIKASRSYLLSRTVTWLPRRLKGGK